MDLYAGIRGGDTPVGGGKFVEDVGFGHEVFNFEPDAKGVFRGYVRPPGQGNLGGQRINIGRLGAGADDDRVEDVQVFWVATHPTLGGTRVVGWYDDATVWLGREPSGRRKRGTKDVEEGRGRACKNAAPHPAPHSFVHEWRRIRRNLSCTRRELQPTANMVGERMKRREHGRPLEAVDHEYPSIHEMLRRAGATQKLGGEVRRYISGGNGGGTAWSVLPERGDVWRFEVGLLAKAPRRDVPVDGDRVGDVKLSPRRKRGNRFAQRKSASRAVHFPKDRAVLPSLENETREFGAVPVRPCDPRSVEAELLEL